MRRTMATIQIDVPNELVGAYERATAEERKRFQVWIELLLKDMARKEKLSLLEAMDRLSAEAQANGLTPEILEEILSDEE